MRKLFVVLTVMFFMCGCGSIAMNKDDYNQRITSVSSGMTKVDFYKSIPEGSSREAEMDHAVVWSFW